MKKKSFSILVVLGLFFVISVVSSTSSALELSVDYDFSGSFTYDNDVALNVFSISHDSVVTLFSSSWLYGNPPVGSGPGGFDPILSLWDSGGNLIDFADDGFDGVTVSNNVSYIHGVFDSFFDVFLTMPGTYIAAITQFDNFSLSSMLTDGFIYDINPDFTFDNGYGGATQSYFNGTWDNNDPRTADWAFHALVQPVPEPSTLLLIGFGITGMAVWKLRLLRRLGK